MNSYRVVFRREALSQLDELYEYIAGTGAPGNAARYIEAIVTFCEDLATFPRRGSLREDIRPGLRTISYRKRVVVAFAILEDTVAILGIFYGGRDHEALLSDVETGEADEPL